MRAIEQGGVVNRADSPEDRYGELYRVHREALLAYALRRAAPEDAADVVATTYLTAWRRMADVPLGEDARLWLFGVARRVLANQHRERRRRSALRDLLIMELPERPLGAQQQESPLSDAIARLSSTDGELLKLTVWDGFSTAEAAALVGIAPGSARTRVHRARAALRKALESNVTNKKGQP